MKIEVLGTGCAKCKSLYDNTKKAVEECGKTAEIIKVLQKEFPQNANTASNVNWYRNKLKNG